MFDSGALSLGHELLAIIERNNFRVNQTKNRLSTRLHRLEVTGITINEFPNVKRNFIDRIRGALHAWEVHGYDLAQTEWQRRILDNVDAAYEKRPWKRQSRARHPPKLSNVLWGKLLYVRMVRGADDALYTRLAERYNCLCSRQQVAGGTFSFSSLPVELIVRNAHDAERAVFVIEWNGDFQPPGAPESEMLGGQGTAFVYEARNHLITCDHVLNWSGIVNGIGVTTDCSAPEVENLSLTVHNPTLGFTLPVRILHRDAHLDLAILEFVNLPPAQRHFSGSDAAIKRNEGGFLIGFPNWNPGRPVNQVNAVVLSCFGRTALQRFEISKCGCQTDFTNFRQLT